MEADTEDKVSPVDSLVSVVVSVIRLDCEESLFNPWLVVIVDKLFKFVVDVNVVISVLHVGVNVEVSVIFDAVVEDPSFNSVLHVVNFKVVFEFVVIDDSMVISFWHVVDDFVESNILDLVVKKWKQTLRIRFHQWIV